MTRGEKRAKTEIWDSSTLKGAEKLRNQQEKTNKEGPENPSKSVEPKAKMKKLY